VPLVVDGLAVPAGGDRPARELGAHLAQLLGHLVGRPLDVRPVEADAGGPVLQAMRTMQGREPGG
jgi:hypothetical protein